MSQGGFAGRVDVIVVAARVQIPFKGAVMKTLLSGSAQLGPGQAQAGGQN